MMLVSLRKDRRERVSFNEIYVGRFISYILYDVISYMMFLIFFGRETI